MRTTANPIAAISSRYLALVLLAAMLSLFALVGCNDPHSQRRIQRRLEGQQALIDNINSLEKHRAARLKQMGPTIRKWHQDDIDLYNRRMPTIGDYVW